MVLNTELIAASPDFGPAAARALGVLTATGIDWVFGEPPAAWHPVVGMGWLLTRVGAGAPWSERSPSSALARGACAWLLCALLVTLLAWLASRAVTGIGALVPPGGRLLIEGFLFGVALKPLLAWRLLRDEVREVEQALACSVEDGRKQLRRIVSRDTGRLTASEVRESAIECLGENFNDSWVAPLFWFALAGLPGAALYRFSNTADACWGYRGAFEWAGKCAARIDDVLSYVPARISAVLLALATPTWARGLSREAARTPSPNGGWPMGTLALALGVRLGKPHVYVLNASSPAPAADDLERGLRIAGRAALMAAALGFLALSLGGAVLPAVCGRCAP